MRRITLGALSVLLPRLEVNRLATGQIPHD